MDERVCCSQAWYQAAIPRGRHSQGPPFPASVVIFIMLMLLRTKEVLVNKKLG